MSKYKRNRSRRRRGKGRVLSRVGREGKARNAGSATGDSCGHLAKQKDGNRAKSLNKRLDPD